MQLTNTFRLIVQKNIIQSWKFSHYQKVQNRLSAKKTLIDTRHIDYYNSFVTLTLSSSTRSILFLPSGLMSLSINAVMMSNPFDSWLAIEF